MTRACASRAAPRAEFATESPEPPFVPAYDEMYLEPARTALATMLDYVVNDLGHRLSDYWETFLSCPVARQFERGNCSVVAGRSGIELAWMVLDGPRDVRHNPPRFPHERSEEYWTGWAIAYYQWETSLRFSDITDRVPIDRIRGLYRPFHEMDERQFADKMDELYTAADPTPPLKARRLARGLSQRDLAERAHVPLRTVQQYEQRQKDIGRAAFDTVRALANALRCSTEDLRDYRGRRR